MVHLGSRSEDNPELASEPRSAGDAHGSVDLSLLPLGQMPAALKQAIIATPSDQSAKGVARRTAALWSAIEQACARDDFRPRPSRLCDFCTFRPYCPAHGGDPVNAVELRGPGTMIEPMLPLV